MLLGWVMSPTKCPIYQALTEKCSKYVVNLPMKSRKPPQLWGGISIYSKINIFQNFSYLVIFLYSFYITMSTNYSVLRLIETQLTEILLLM
jgi:hypothetical protein